MEFEVCMHIVVVASKQYGMKLKKPIDTSKEEMKCMLIQFKILFIRD